MPGYGEEDRIVGTEGVVGTGGTGLHREAGGGGGVRIQRQGQVLGWGGIQRKGRSGTSYRDGEGV